MPSRTFAFSHRGGYWKTRYTFASSAFATINKILVSFNQQFKNQPVFRHDAGGLTTFYGYNGGSGMVVTFNDLPSNNKIYKSVSVEGTNNLDITASVVVNNSTTPNQQKPSPLITFDDKGGILYGLIQGLPTRSNSNVKLVGVAYAIPEIAIGDAGANQQTVQLGLQMQFVDGGRSIFSERSKFFFRTNDGNGFFVTSPNGPFFQDFGQYEDFETSPQPSWETTPPQLGGATDNILRLVGAYDNIAAYPFSAADWQAQLPLQVFVVSDETVHGDQLRGQTCDAEFTLGSADYELYALNLEYEATPYDHSGSPTTGGKRRRGKR